MARKYASHASVLCCELAALLDLGVAWPRARITRWVQWHHEPRKEVWGGRRDEERGDGQEQRLTNILSCILEDSSADATMLGMAFAVLVPLV